MSRKKQSTHSDKRADKSKPNLGQKEAELDKAGTEQMSHMGEKDARKAAQPQPSKRGKS